MKKSFFCLGLLLAECFLGAAQARESSKAAALIHAQLPLISGKFLIIQGELSGVRITGREVQELRALLEGLISQIQGLEREPPSILGNQSFTSVEAEVDALLTAIFAHKRPAPGAKSKDPFAHLRMYSLALLASWKPLDEDQLQCWKDRMKVEVEDIHFEKGFFHHAPSHRDLLVFQEVPDSLMEAFLNSFLTKSRSRERKAPRLLAAIDLTAEMIRTQKIDVEKWVQPLILIFDELIQLIDELYSKKETKNHSKAEKMKVKLETYLPIYYQALRQNGAFLSFWETLAGKGNARSKISLLFEVFFFVQNQEKLRILLDQAASDQGSLLNSWPVMSELLDHPEIDPALYDRMFDLMGSEVQGQIREGAHRRELIKTCAKLLVKLRK